MNILRNLCLLGIWVTAFPNTLLTSIFFIALLESVQYIMPVYGYETLMLLGLFFGGGFVIAEAVANILKVRGKQSLGFKMVIGFILVLCGYVNVGAGSERASKTDLNKANNARLNIASDPVYMELVKTKEYYAGILNDGDPTNDAKAQDDIERVDRQIMVLSNQYANNSDTKTANSSIGGKALVDVVVNGMFNNKGLATFSMLALNLFFSMFIQTWYKLTNEYKNSPLTFPPTKKKGGIKSSFKKFVSDIKKEANGIKSGFTSKRSNIPQKPLPVDRGSRQRVENPVGTKSPVIGSGVQTASKISTYPKADAKGFSDKEKEMVAIYYTQYSQTGKKQPSIVKSLINEKYKTDISRQAIDNTVKRFLRIKNSQVRAGSYTPEFFEFFTAIDRLCKMGMAVEAENNQKDESINFVEAEGVQV